jgi:hypothetical protein
MKRLMLWLLLGLTPALADGQITVTFEPSQRQVGQNLRAIPQFQQLWQAVAHELNAAFVFPRNLPVIFADIGQANAFYSPDKHVIVVGYEMFEELAKAYKPMSGNDEELGNNILGGIFFIFFHELGHALIGELGLPTVGREEDAVDEFSALLLSDDENGQRALVSASSFFATTATDPTIQAYFDEHSLNLQRVSTILTILHAANPRVYGPLCQQLGIPDRVLQRAQVDYPKKQKAWETLLKPHLEAGAQL